MRSISQDQIGRDLLFAHCNESGKIGISDQTDHAPILIEKEKKEEEEKKQNKTGSERLTVL